MKNYICEKEDLFRLPYSKNKMKCASHVHSHPYCGKVFVFGSYEDKTFCRCIIKGRYCDVEDDALHLHLYGLVSMKKTVSTIFFFFEIEIFIKQKL